MFDRAYVVMDRLPGTTLNELTYRRPEVIEDNRVTISYQLGMHMAFSFVFGSKDGYQTNYVFDATTKILTRIDKESFLDLPLDAEGTLQEGDSYTQEIAACELSNLKYIPSFRDPATRPKMIFAFKQGFLDKFADIKFKREELVSMVESSRQAWLRMKPVEDMGEYAQDTRHLTDMVNKLIGLNPEQVFKRLMKAKTEVESGKYSK
jgi:hypothetical protein